MCVRLSVRPSVRPSVGPSVGPYVMLRFSGLLGATCAVFTSYDGNDVEAQK